MSDLPGDKPSTALLLTGSGGTVTLNLEPFGAGTDPPAAYGVLEHAGWWKWQPAANGFLDVTITGPAGWEGVIELYERSQIDKPDTVGQWYIRYGAAAPGQTARMPVVAGTWAYIRIHPFNSNDAVDNARISWSYTAAHVAKIYGLGTFNVDLTTAPVIVEPPRVVIARIDFSGEAELFGELGASVEHKIQPTVDFSSDGTLGGINATATSGTQVWYIGTRLRRRWRFHDSRDNDSWEMPMNPKEMSSPHAPRTFKYAHGVRSGIKRMRVFETPHEPILWEFSGVTYTKQHYDKLLSWTKKDHPVEITDHLDRTFRVIMQDFIPEDRRNGRPPKSSSLSDDQRWRNTYTIKALILRRVS